MRLFYAALALEANTFLPLPTSYRAFVEKLYYPPGQLSGEAIAPDRRDGRGARTGKGRRVRADRRLLLRGAAGRRRFARRL